ncbi:hypothetical protein GWD52_21140 [Enterobacteriaceae bacterium 4M9]|nr:hypothetical protein [Enterobacteriaceae bacterium 4M9]
MQVNITTQVNSKSIRREQYNGREHWVVPSYTLPADVVMNDGLYSVNEIDAHYQGLEGTLAPLGHPQVNGQFVSAFSPEGINVGHIGAWNRNVKKAGNRVYVEKWIDTEVARRTENGNRLLGRLEALEKGDDVPPVHTSVAVFLDQLKPNEQQAATGAKWVAKIHAMDHDAILLDEVGAATPEQGVGMMVNADLAMPLNFGAADKDNIWPVIVNKLKSFFMTQEQPAPNHKTEGDMPLTTEEKQELIGEIGKGVAANVAEALKPVMEKVDALQANHDKLAETLTANSRAEEKTKRDAVAKMHGEVVANALSGDALDAMYKSLGESAPLGTNSGQQQKETGAPDPASYFGEAK